MDEQLAYLKSVTERLDALGLEYMLTGSLALAIWSRPRMTRDADLIVSLTEADVPALVAAFASDSYVSEEAAQEAVVARQMFNIIDSQSLTKADIIVLDDAPYERTKFARRRRVDVDGFSLWVISVEDLVLSKLTWGRETGSARQAEDVAQLLREGRELDVAYLAEWAKALGVEAALAAARR